ncbi:MAG: hypothetical protein ACOX2P_02725 [Bacillota bacterium]|jgi:hypothetical protein
MIKTVAIVLLVITAAATLIVLYRGLILPLIQPLIKKKQQS